MSDNKALDDFWEFVLKRLEDVKKTATDKYKDNSNNRKYNIFNCLEDKTIRKYMGLGRSFDSKLGIEIQNIAMKLARVKYGDINVPNIILINTEDENDNRKFKLNLYTIKDNFQQRVFYNIKPNDFLRDFNNDNIELSESIDFTMSKRSRKATLTKLNKYKITDKKKDLNKNKKILVDLLYIEDMDDATKTKITTFELKSGGNLDTKNSISNVNEVKLLKDIFKFFPQNDSFFATAYNNAGKGVPSGDVFTKLKAKNLEYKVGEDFWNMLLPEGLKYESFIENYKQKFIESRIEAKFKRLDLMKYQTRKQFSKKRQKRKTTPKKYSKKNREVKNWRIALE